MAYNLLTDPVIRIVRRDGEPEALSLPAVMAVLAADEVASFPALRAHQRHGWHAFLTQLAAIVLHEGQVDEIPTEAKVWRALIRGVTVEYGDDPWTLVVSDWSRPAFLQCPDPGRGRDFKREIHTPDGMDILVTSKNHDEKQNQAYKASPDDWIFALVTLQTMAGYSGRSNYGIVRMNSGLSTRWGFGLAPVDAGPGGHLVSDLRRMLSTRATIISCYPEYFVHSGGTQLVWLDPWDGKQSSPLRELDPYFIEICRRVRLCQESNSIRAKKALSKGPRIQAKSAKGDVGDFWTPIRIKGGAALTPSRRTVQYDKLAEILFDPGKYKLPPGMQGTAQIKCSKMVVVRGWVGGQGKTKGYFERSDLRFGKKIIIAFGRNQDRDRLAELTREQLKEVASVAAALKYAIAVLANGGRAEDLKRNHWDSANMWSGQFDRLVDGVFFRFLDSRFENGNGGHREEFGLELIGFAKKIFRQASGAMAWPSSARHRALAVGEMTLRRRLRKSTFGDLVRTSRKEQAAAGVATE